MKMFVLCKIGIGSAILFLMFGLCSCGGDSAAGLTVDCSKSNLSVSIVNIVDSQCDALGSVVVSAVGGSGNVSFSVNGVDFQSSGTFNLSAGNYTITAKDKNCTVTVNATVNPGENAIAFGITESTNAGCGTSNGSITVSASGGVSTLMYKLDNGALQESPIFTGVSAGNHAISADDGTCSAQTTKFVLAGTSLNNEIMPLIDLKCATNGCHNGDNGSIPNLKVKSNVINQALLIKEFTQSGFMPQNGSLTNDQKALIACWVDDGALDN